MSMWIKYIFQLAVIALSLMVYGCDNGSELCSNDEVKRISSPDNIVDAVVVLKKCGATVSDSYRVYVVKKDGTLDFDDDSSMFVSDKTDGIKVFWRGNKELQISYAKARIFQFKNFWQSKDVDNFRYIVSVTEKLEGPTSK